MMKKRIIAVSTFLAFLFLIPSLLSADYEAYEYRIIRIAFMNGCVRVLEWDMDKIESLKKNPDELKKQVALEVDQYIKKVAELNGEMYAKQFTERGSGKASKRKGWLW